MRQFCTLAFTPRRHSLFDKSFLTYQYYDICSSSGLNRINFHIGVRGNERADSAAKSVLDLTPDKSRIPYTDLKPTINKFLHTKWQQKWSNNIHNKLFQIQPTWESGDQYRENQEENKLLYPDCELVIQGLLTLSFWNRNYNKVFDLPDNLHG